jgi:hypothetical protein
MARETKNLPVVITDDYGLIITNPEKVKVGQMGSFVDGRWSPRGGETFQPGTRMLFRGMVCAVQGWQGGQLIGEYIEQPDKPLPDIELLNKEIPKNTWDIGLDDEPREPYAKYRVVYATNKEDGATYTFSNCTLGQRIGYEELQTKLAIDAAEGKRGIPEIELCSKPMATRKGPKLRPFFKVVGYFGDGAPQAVERGPTPQTPTAATRQIEHDNKKERQPNRDGMGARAKELLARPFDDDLDI